MIKKVLYVALIYASTLVSCKSIDLVTQEEVQNEIPELDDSIYKSGEVRVKISRSLSEMTTKGSDTDNVTLKEAISNDIEGLNITSIQRLFPYSGKFESRSREMDMHLWYVVKFDNDISVTKVESSFNFKNGSVVKVEKVPIAIHYKSELVPQIPYEKGVTAKSTPSSAKTKTSGTFNDPRLEEQWHYYNDGSGTGAIAGADVNVYPVWEKGYVGNPSVIVCVVDAGIEFEHEDIYANRYINYAELNGEPGVDSDGNGFIDDVYGYNFFNNNGTIIGEDHGTHVAGLIAATNNNGIGVCGVAGGNGEPNTGVKLMSAQVYYKNSGTDGAPAIKYGADNGAVISQNSWGYPSLTSIPESDALAIEYFVKYAGVDENGVQTGPIKGGIIVFASGNENRVLSIPGSHPDAVAVTSIAPDYTKAYYSNYGEWADIAAPGGSLEYKYGENQAGGILSTVANNSYGLMQGTSMACPIVSGAFALMVSQIADNGEMGVTGKDVVDKMLRRTRNIDKYDPTYAKLMGVGLLDIERAIGGQSIIAPESIEDFRATNNTHNNATFEWSVPKDEDDGQRINFMIYYSTKSLNGVDYNNLPNDVNAIYVNEPTLVVGETMSFQIANLLPSTKYYATILSNDYSDNISLPSNEVVFTTNANRAPEIKNIEGNEITIKKGGIGKIRFELFDADGDEIFIKAVNDEANVVTLILDNNTMTVFVNTLELAVGEYNFIIEATDQYGASDRETLKCFVIDGKAPVQIKDFEDEVIEGINNELIINWREHFNDEDSEQLTVRVKSNNSIFTSTISGDKISFKAQEYGESEIQLSVSDGINSILSNKFKLLCKEPSPEPEQIELSLYPNPVVDILNIKSNKRSEAKINIYNVNGVNVMTKDNTELVKETPLTLDLKTLSPGQYNVTIEADNQVITRKITKI